jgi:hypothetical protein
MNQTKRVGGVILWLALFLGLGILYVTLSPTISSRQENKQPGRPVAQITSTLTIYPPPIVPTVLTPPDLPTLPLYTPTPTPTLTPTSSPPGPHPEGILYESGGELFWQEIQNAQVIGTPEHLFPYREPETTFAKLSLAPDGMQVVYRTDEWIPDAEVGYSFYRFLPPYGQASQISMDNIAEHKVFGWHPNNQELVFGTYEGVVGLINVQTSQTTLFADVNSWGNFYAPPIEGAAISPNGQDLIVSFVVTETHQVWLNKSSGIQGPQKLFESRNGFYSFSWSPNGQLIAFLGQGIEIVSPSDLKREVVNPNRVGDWPFDPRWSPDGRYLAFVVWDQAVPDTDLPLLQDHKIHIYDSQSKTEWQLVPDMLAGEVEPTWSPDSNWLVFLSNRSGAAEVWVSNLQGTQLSQISADNTAKRWAPVWLPATGGE